jgi:hypothetical protein
LKVCIDDARFGREKIESEVQLHWLAGRENQVGPIQLNLKYVRRVASQPRGSFPRHPCHRSFEQFFQRCLQAMTVEIQFDRRPRRNFHDKLQTAPRRWPLSPKSNLLFARRRLDANLTCPKLQ